MYVIYPADELINWLIEREYTSTSSPTSPGTASSDAVVSPVEPPAPPYGQTPSNPNNTTTTLNAAPNRHSHFRQRSIVSESASTSATTVTTTTNSSDTVPDYFPNTTTTTSSKKNPPPEVVKPPRREKKPKAPSSPLPSRTLFTNPFKRDKVYPNESPLPGRKTDTLNRSNPRLNPTIAFTEPEPELPDCFVNYRERNTGGNLQRLKLQERKVGFQEDFKLNSNSTSGGTTGGSSLTGGFHSTNPFLFPKGSNNNYDSRPATPTRELSSGKNKAGKDSHNPALNAKMNSILGGSVGSGGMSSSGSGGTNLVTDATSLKDLLHPSLNDTLKCHNALTFKLIRIDFTQQLSQQHEQHAVELQLLVDNFRKRNAELRKERPPCSSSLFQVWETLLQEVEIDSQAHSDLSGSLGRQVARPLLEKTFCKKIQSRKIFAHRESFETVLNKTEALLASTYRDYCDACMAHVQQGTSTSMANYLDAHNAYVLQLRGTNAMLKEYHNETLPALLQELDEIYIDLCNNLSDSILHGADLVASRMQETNRRYETLANVCRNVSGTQDLRDLVKSLTVPAAPNQRHAFTQPVPLIPPADGVEIPLIDKSHVPVLRDEILLERFSTPAARKRQEALAKEMTELESEMKQLQDSLDTLIRMQQRSLDSNLFNKANELQEEISMKRFDLRVAQMHLAALKAQTRTDTTGKEDSVDGKSASGGVGGPASVSEKIQKEEKEKYIRDRKMSVSSNATMKSKWMKAFRTLKGPQQGPSSPSKEPENETKSEKSEKSEKNKNQNQMFLAVTAIMMMRKNGKEKEKQPGGEAFQIFENHIFQEYTYKKITPCDICSQVLRGHTKQGLRCRLCKLNVHTDCQGKVSKCLPKTRLLRRQRSTSELETRLNQISNEPAPGEDESTARSGQGAERGEPRPDEPDLIYQVLKQATDIKKTGGSSSGSGSGNGIHGSSQTLYSQHEISAAGGIPVTAVSAASRRSNPAVNVVGQSAGPASGATTPGGAAQALASGQPSSSGRRSSEQRRDSYVSHKSVSADPPGRTTPIYLVPPARPRCISLPETPQTPHSPRRRKLDLRMKSFSLDSPESTEHAQRRRYAHGSQSTSHSQYWRLSSYYTNSTEDDGMNEESSSQPPNDHHHHYNYGMVHSKSANVNPTHCTSSSVSLKRASTPPSSLLTTSAHSDSLYSATTSTTTASNNATTTNDYSQSQSPSFASLNHFAPSSPVHNRRALLSTRNVRMSSVELPDENDKSLSSASTSPCPSPKPHRLLPTNLYVVLYMFKARHPDELDLKAGYKVTVTDTTDPDWWQGKCMGRVGYFPSKYVTKLQPGEKPLQVTHNLQVTDGAENGLKLLRDQIVIQIGEELDGMVTIRNGENKQGICPLKYLQEV